MNHSSVYRSEILHWLQLSSNSLPLCLRVTDAHTSIPTITIRHNTMNSNNQKLRILNKGGVTCEGEISSAVRLGHSCERNALLEMIKCALKSKWGYA